MHSAGYVYVLRRRIDGAFKVGHTREPKLRYQQLRSAHGPIEMVAIMPGSATDERRLHERFNASALGGEWFASSPELEAAVEAIRTLHGPPDVESFVGSVQTAIRLDPAALKTAETLRARYVKQHGSGAISDVVRRAIMLGLEALEKEEGESP